MEQSSKYTKIGEWNLSWCFHCEGACAHCPACGGNSCACGCMHQDENGKCAGEEWWKSLQTLEFKITQQMYWRPSRQEVTDYIRLLENLEETQKHWVHHYTLLQVAKYAKWHGIEFELTLGTKDKEHSWNIKLIAESPYEDRGRHIKSREKVIDQMQWALTCAKRDLGLEDE